MASTWVVLADEGRARILEWREPGTELAEVEQLEDPAAHAHNADFRRDAYGRRAPGGTAASNQTESAGQEDLLQLDTRALTQRFFPSPGSDAA